LAPIGEPASRDTDPLWPTGTARNVVRVSAFKVTITFAYAPAIARTGFWHSLFRFQGATWHLRTIFASYGGASPGWSPVLGVLTLRHPRGHVKATARASVDTPPGGRSYGHQGR
jgi:hypothetical protein